jgi:hypothetical protein
MSQVQAYVASAVFSAMIKPDSVAPLSDPFPFKLPINFDSVSEVSIFNGKYTPTNDFVYIFNGLLATKSPNWMLVICDAQMNLYLQRASGNVPLNWFPIIRFGFFSWLQDNTDFVNLLMIDGRTVLPQPMIQAVPVNYTIITGKGVLS